jgi:hypothetical protein
MQKNFSKNEATILELIFFRIKSISRKAKETLMT